MSVVIKVNNLSKVYRVGAREYKSNTLTGKIGNLLRSPLTNFKKLRSLNRFNTEEKNIHWALKDINFSVNQGELLGIIGHNGAGKSTLLKILSRITAPTTGEIEIIGKVSSLLEVGTGFHSELTGRDNIYMNGTIHGLRKKEIDNKLEEIINFSGIEKYIDTPVKFYSSGMKVRLGFAVAAHLEPDILIIDEVLAVGDEEFQRKCIGKMKQVSSQGRTVLFVSHQMGAVNDLCQKALLLDKGSVVYSGKVEDVISKYLSTNNTMCFINNSIQLQKPDIIKIDLDEKMLKTGTFKLTINFLSPFDLSPPIAGIVIRNSIGIPVFGTNPRMHPGSYDMEQVSRKGTIYLNIKDIPLLTGSYNITVYLGDTYQDYQVYENIITFNYITNEIDNTKIPNLKNIGSINLSNSEWKFSHSNL